MATRYRPVDPKVAFPELEGRILRFWRESDIFAKSMAARRGAPEFVFYEGPPTANGRPGIHHVEARTFKDVFLRFKSMTGQYVFRKAGWDCHGLPVELEVEKEIGTKTKRDIEDFGIAEFNRLCRESVSRYVADWEKLTERIGFWIDMGEAYWTMAPDYIQTVWWALKELHGQGLLFQDDKVTWYCPRCGTALSDAEVAMGYATVTDPSVYLKFRVVGPEGAPRSGAASLVAWTTTPWTLISNLGLAVDRRAPYVLVESDGERLILAEALAPAVLGEDVAPLETFTGASLEGLVYEPPYANVDDGTHRVVAADFVSMGEGTGIVHLAPAFGAEDLEVARRESWPMFNPVDGEGRFTDLAPGFVRFRSVKEADPVIIDDLRTRGLLLRAEEIEHTYPLCWRCDTPLINYARPAWYIRTTARKQELLEANEATTWFPDHVKHGRYGDWLDNNVDWSLSRERYWGTPLPIWLCAEGHHTVVESLAELSGLAGRDVTGIDPHRPDVDEVTVPCPECGSEARRVSEVIDTWFDSGAMPYAQWGYTGPGSPAADVFRKRFPADFITEAIDQTRGWFYTLMAESVLLFGQNSYRNVVVLGHIVDAQGRKMSKSLGNVIEPWTLLDRQGADAVRWFFLASGSPWSARRVSVEAVDEVVRRFLLTLWNTYAFHVTYANIDQPDLAAAPVPGERAPLDRWALSRLHSTAGAVLASMEGYDATAAAREIVKLVDDLSNWYVRRSRRRFWDPARTAPDSGETAAKLAAYATLGECLAGVARMLAPFTPFVAEEIYRNLVAERDPEAPESVHLTDFPSGESSLVDPSLEEGMAMARAVVALGRTVRADAKVRVRQPLARAVVHVPGDRARLSSLLPLVADELNVKEVAFAESAEEFAGWRAKPNFRVLGPRLGPRVQEIAAALADDDGTLASTLSQGQMVTLDLPTEAVMLTPGDVELSQRTRAGWGLASDGSVTVALDLDLERSPGLRREGMVRELIHQVQNLRKAAGLGITDRIVLEVQADTSERLAYAAETSKTLIGSEVLAVEVTVTSPSDVIADGWDATTRVEVDGVPVRLSLRLA